MACGSEWQGGDRTRAKVKDYISKRLGCDVIGLELSDDQLDIAIQDAEDYWMMWVGRVRMIDLQLTGKHEYSIADLAEDVDSVVDVYFSSDDSNIGNMYAWADVEYNPFLYSYGGQGGYSMYAQYLQYRKDAIQLMNADNNWQWDDARRLLIIQDNRQDHSMVKVAYLSRCFDYNYLKSYYWRLFRDYAVARAMRTLAIIRMKFADKPSASGSFTMDGDAMWANAEAMEMAVDDKMRNLQKPVGLFIG